VKVPEFVTAYPRLFHVTEVDAWPGIEQNGLLSAASLLDLYDVEADRRRELVSQLRPEPVQLTADDLPPALLHAQNTIDATKLEASLTDITLPDWLTMLSDFVSLAPTPARLASVESSWGYRPRVVVILNSRTVVAEHQWRLRLSHINTSATTPAARPRGAATFQPLGTFAHPKKDWAAEVAVQGGIRDIGNHLLGVEKRFPDGTVEKIR
jgi:hypothetical protein